MASLRCHSKSKGGVPCKSTTACTISPIAFPGISKIIIIPSRMLKKRITFTDAFNNLLASTDQGGRNRMDNLGQALGEGSTFVSLIAHRNNSQVTGLVGNHAKFRAWDMDLFVAAIELIH